MSDSLVVEQATKMVGQIIDDYERLAQEFLALNLEEILEDDKAQLKVLTIMNLTNIRNSNQVAYMFLEGIKAAAKDN